MAVMNPDYRFDDVDVIINRGKMMTLIQFIRDLSIPAFAMTLNVIRKTLIVGRRMKTYMGGCSPGSYGRSYEAEWSAQVEPELKDAKGHYRVSLYSFGDLKITVKLEVDAYVSNDGVASADNHTKPIEAFLAQTMSRTADNIIYHDSPRPTMVLLAGKLNPHEDHRAGKQQEAETHRSDVAWSNAQRFPW